MWDAPLGNLRDAGFSLPALWNAAGTLARRREIVEEKCPHCWTPCEAYQTILANLPLVIQRFRNSPPLNRHK